jgi:CheY-like chemotaxis protein
MPSKTVLIVDDEMSNTQLFGMMLELEGYRPVAALDARTALEVLRGERPDAMIVDVMLPGISGLELCQTCAASWGWPICRSLSSRPNHSWPTSRPGCRPAPISI